MPELQLKIPFGSYCWVLVWCTLFTIPPVTTDLSHYRCPPCGLNCDQLSHEKPGRCPVCLMELMVDSEIHKYDQGPLQQLRKQGVFNFIIGLGISQGLLMLILLLFNKRRTSNTSNKYLALLMVGIISGCCYFLLLEYRIFYQHPVLSLLPLKIFFLIGTSLYLYVRSAIGMTHTIRQVIWNYSPAIFVVAISILMIVLNISPVSRVYAIYDLYILGFAAQIHVLVYTILTYRLLKQYRIELNNNLSAISKSQSQWLKNLVFFIFLLLALISIYVLLSLVSPGLLLGRYLFLFWIFASLFVYWISYTVYQQPEIFQIKEVKLRPAQQLPEDQTMNPYLAALRLSMEQDQLFLKPNLTRKTLADHIRINPNTLSLILNQHLKKSFYDFVNEYRVKEVMRKMSDPGFLHYTLEGMAYESGFNSKSTFNAIFKKVSGQTPRQYKKEIASI